MEETNQSFLPQAEPPNFEKPFYLKYKLPVLIISWTLSLLLIWWGYNSFFANKQGKACTKEAKICPDGSSVGRVGPNCEFTPCPSSQAPQGKPTDETANWKTYTNSSYGYTIKIPTPYLATECMYSKVLRISNNAQGAECQQEYSGLVITVYDAVSKDSNLASLRRDYSLKQEGINTNGTSGVKLEGNLVTYPAPIPKHIISSYFEKGVQTYFIEYYDYDNGAQATLYSQILQTFRFLNQQMTLSPTKSVSKEKDCGKPTFFVLPGPPFDQTNEVKAREYFSQYGLAVVAQQGSQFTVKPTDGNSVANWIQKMRQETLWEIQYDTVGCDFAN